MSGLEGTIVDYNGSTQQGRIQPTGEGSHVYFKLSAVENPKPPPQKGDKVSFKLSGETKKFRNKVCGIAQSVRITQRAPTRSGRTMPKANRRKESLRAAQRAPTASPTTDPRAHTRLVGPGMPKYIQEMRVDPYVGAPNPGLVMDKYVVHEDHNFGRRLVHWKEASLRMVLSAYDSSVVTADAKKEFGRFYKSWTDALSKLNAVTFSASSAWRLAIHLGRQAPLENATICLHRTRGFPFLPGQGLKGLAFAAANRLHDSSGGEPSDEDIKAVFGTQQGRGAVVFFDAVPTEVPQLELDVLTPHFPQWYSGQNSPSDDQEPKPVLFLTVAPKSKFLFALAGPEADDNRAK